MAYINYSRNRSLFRLIVVDFYVNGFKLGKQEESVECKRKKI